MANELLHNLEGGKRRIEIEEEERKKDFKKRKQKQDAGLMPPPKMDNENTKVTERKKLILPTPQVNETVLEEIVKIGFTGKIYLQ